MCILVQINKEADGSLFCIHPWDYRYTIV